MSDLCVIGDVHGEMHLLERLLEKVPSNTKLIFVGDLVNRGPSSRDVLDFVGDLIRKGSAQVVMGNHERALLSFLEHGDFVEFAHHGGAATIRSYVGQARADVHQHFIESFPKDHEELIRGFLPIFESDNLVVAHHPVDPSQNVLTYKEDLHIPSYSEYRSSIDQGKYIVYGHFPQRQVTCRGRSIYLDTGCGYGGGLSCLFWPERNVLTVSDV